MTRAEYLEHVEESLAFRRKPWDQGEWAPYVSNGEPFPDHGLELREPEEVVHALREAHTLYCELVRAILFPEQLEEGRRKVLLAVVDSKIGSQPGVCV